MIISNANPIQLYMLSAPAAFASPVNLVALGVTFNCKPKDPRVQKRLYFHRQKNDDTFSVEIVVDNTAHAYKLFLHLESGIPFAGISFTQLYDDQFKVTVNLSDYAAQNETKIFYSVVDETDVTLYAVSDLHQITSNPGQSVTCTYTNDIEYNNISAESSNMTIRLPASFYESEFPDETETFEQSEGSIVELTGSTKEQRLLNVAHVPDDIHRKIKLILKMRTKYIESLSWKYEQLYEMLPKKNPFFEMRRGKVLLTLDGSVVRNVYSVAVPASS